MSELSWCPKCGRDLDAADYEVGYCSGCGERLEYVVPEPDEAAYDKAASEEPEQIVWQIDGEWAVCPRCGASYALADEPAVCERCVPDPSSAKYAYLYPQKAASAPVLVLTHAESGLATRISSDETVLGRNITPGLEGRKFVGRQHARITLRGGRFFAADMDSKNGTKVNGQRLAPGEEAELSDGDVLELDVERFTVSL